MAAGPGDIAPATVNNFVSVAAVVVVVAADAGTACSEAAYAAAAMADIGEYDGAAVAEAAGRLFERKDVGL